MFFVLKVLIIIHTFFILFEGKKLKNLQSKKKKVKKIPLFAFLELFDACNGIFWIFLLRTLGALRQLHHNRGLALLRCSPGVMLQLVLLALWIRNSVVLHTNKSVRNLIKSNRNQISFTMYRLVWNQTNGRLVPNQSENGKYNPISVWSNKILERTSPCAWNFNNDRAWTIFRSS